MTIAAADEVLLQRVLKTLRSHGHKALAGQLYQCWAAAQPAAQMGLQVPPPVKVNIAGVVHWPQPVRVG